MIQTIPQFPYVVRLSGNIVFIVTGGLEIAEGGVILAVGQFIEHIQGIYIQSRQFLHYHLTPCGIHLSHQGVDYIRFLILSRIL